MRKSGKKMRGGGINKNRTPRTVGRGKNKLFHDASPITETELTFIPRVASSSSPAIANISIVTPARSGLRPPDILTPATLLSSSVKEMALATPSPTPSLTRTLSRGSRRDSISSCDSSYSSDDEPQVPVYLLTDLDSLVEEAQPGSFVALDIDETIIVTHGSPSLLLTSQGVQSFQKYVHKHVKEWTAKNNHCRNLQKALKQKVLVTPTTATAIRTLQAKGCWLFGLTSRYSEFYKATERELGSLGINLAERTPFPAQITEGDVFVRNGIIYCNNQAKGPVLKELLAKYVFREVLEAKFANADPAVSSRDDPAIPPELFFVDDIYSNASNVSANLAPMMCTELGVSITCYHYVPHQLAELQAYPNPTAFDLSDDETSAEQLEWKQVLHQQMEEFVRSGTVLTNEAARKELGIA